MVTSPQVSWLFFKARAKRPYLSHTGRASNAEKQPTGRGPEGCVENGPAAALLVGYVSIEICALLAPCRRPILNATTSPLYARRYTRCGAQDLEGVLWIQSFVTFVIFCADPFVDRRKRPSAQKDTARRKVREVHGVEASRFASGKPSPAGI